MKQKRPNEEVSRIFDFFNNSFIARAFTFFHVGSEEVVDDLEDLLASLSESTYVVTKVVRF